MVSTEVTAPQKIQHPALFLLGWICAIGATGASLSALSLVDASEALGLSAFMRAAAAGAISLTIAATAVPAGLLADRIGRRRLLLTSFVVTASANVFIAAVPHGWAYLTGLIVAGLGYGAMGTGSYAYVKRIAPASSLGRALGLLGVYISSLTFLANVGGGLLSDANWRWLFVPLPIMCLVALLATPRLLPAMERINSGSVDWPGIVLLSTAIVSLVFGLTRMSNPGAALSGWWAIGTSAILLAIWVLVESRQHNPLLPLGLLRRKLFIGAALVGVLMSMTMGAAVLGISDLLQYADRDSVFSAAMLLQPFFVIGSLGGIVAGRYLSRGHSASAVALWGAITAGVGFLLMAPATASTPYLVVLPGILIAGIGLAATLTAQAQVFIQAALGERYGPMTSLKTTFTQIGSSIGMVLSVTALQIVTDDRLPRATAAADLPQISPATALQVLQSFIESGQPPAVPEARAVLHAAIGAFAQAFDILMVACAVTCAVAALVAWRWLPKKG